MTAPIVRPTETNWMLPEGRPQHPSKEEIEAHQREQSRELVRRFEEGEPNPPQKLECQLAKAYLDRGEEYVGELTGVAFEEAFDHALGENEGEPKGPTLEERFANEGYECTPPTPAEVDKKYEKPADNPKQREIQCGPQSNASPEFREKYC